MIDWLRRRAAQSSAHVAVGIGDDAAVWRPSRGKSVVLTVDAHVDGVHFRSAWSSPREVGRRAVAAAVSDLAAMASRPRLLLVAVTLPEGFSPASFRALERGIEEEAERCAAAVAGGNISAGSFALSITAVGEASPDAVVTRAGARAGDGIWVTGSPGLSGLGYELLAGNAALGSGAGASLLRGAAERAYRFPHARVREATHLARRWPLRAMIDLSDGLYADLGHVLEASRGRGPLGAEIDEGALASLPYIEALAAATGRRSAQVVLAPSDDYELCFTARPTKSEERSARAFTRRFRLALTRIGSITRTRGIFLRGTDGKRRRAEGRGWEH